MKVIIAGSRTSVLTYEQIQEIVDKSGFEVTEVVSGRCKGVDISGENWAVNSNIHVEPFPAEWDNLKQPGAVIKTRKDGSQYNASAGKYRNRQMAKYADALIAIWDGKSGGTGHMISAAREEFIPVFVHKIGAGS